MRYRVAQELNLTEIQTIKKYARASIESARYIIDRIEEGEFTFATLEAENLLKLLQILERLRTH